MNAIVVDRQMSEAGIEIAECKKYRALAHSLTPVHISCRKSQSFFIDGSKWILPQYDVTAGLQLPPRQPSQ